MAAGQWMVFVILMFFVGSGLAHTRRVPFCRFRDAPALRVTYTGRASPRCCMRHTPRKSRYKLYKHYIIMVGWLVGGLDFVATGRMMEHEIPLPLMHQHSRSWAAAATGVFINMVRDVFAIFTNLQFQLFSGRLTWSLSCGRTTVVSNAYWVAKGRAVLLGTQPWPFSSSRTKPF